MEKKRVALLFIVFLGIIVVLGTMAYYSTVTRQKPSLKDYVASIQKLGFGVTEMTLAGCYRAANPEDAIHKDWTEQSKKMIEGYRKEGKLLEERNFDDFLFDLKNVKENYPLYCPDVVHIDTQVKCFWFMFKRHGQESSGLVVFYYES
jgi:hypothetical protein